MKIIAVNAGSSSLKFQLLNMPEETIIISGVFERIGIEGSGYKMSYDGQTYRKNVLLEDHSKAVNVLLDELINLNAVQSINEIDGVGHRVVHGGEQFTDSIEITDDVIKAIEDVSHLAPLHNPANLTGIKAFQAALPHIKGVAVFDTAFHQTMDPATYLYGVPYDWYEQHGVRKYGFHGTSHKFVSERAAELLGKPIEDTKTIVLHLGNGASICAVDGGKSVDTSMGFTPLAGIMMGTRSGDIDPAIVEFMCKQENLSVSEVITKLNKESGYLGFSKISSDSRDIWSAYWNGNKHALLTIEKHVKMIVDYVAAYYVKMGGADAICFTAGLGENAMFTRQLIAKRLEVLGVKMDPLKNHIRGEERILSSDESSIKLFLIPTNEEVMIARDTVRLSSK